MKLTDFTYTLPPELIARYPLPERSASRMLVLHRASGACEHRHFKELVDYLNPGDCLIFNDSRVIPARVFGHKKSGGKVELLIERVLGNQQVLAHVKTSKGLREGIEFYLEDGSFIRPIERHGSLWKLELLGDASLMDVLHAIGHMPLPPYLDREDERSDQQRYQTVYAKNDGSVAAPTAGLHFDQPILTKLKNKGVKIAYVTLHVGAGTFQPVRTDNILDHTMHSEVIDVPAETVALIEQTKATSKRVIAIGTTAVRSLESAAQSGVLKPYQGETAIFIYPGYHFKVIDGMLTNFHLPESTLLMLISAFAGREKVMQAYQQAIEQRYRFFSYGDSMLILS
jgi:S-adenosylmethionine:tRNA ribosyltransferase-isomerase